MQRFGIASGVRGLVLGSLMAIGAFFASGSAEAGHWCSHCHYEWVVRYEYQQVPYTRYVTYYDHCGKPYSVPKTYFQTIRVPVKHRVQVCY